MAEMLLSFAMDLMLKQVGSYAIQEISGAWRLKKDLQKLSELTHSIHGKVQEARNNQAANEQAVKPLLVKLQDVLYSADDVLDDFSYEILRRQIEIHHQPRLLRMCGFASRNNPVLFPLKMARKVNKINRSLEDLEKQALREFAFTGKTVADSVVVSNDQLNRETVSSFNKSAPPVVGRAIEVEAIINMLQVSSSTPSPLTFVSIVGFGGLGKTTLARMVFHEVKKTKLFDETIWVCVSEPFEVKKILIGMLEILDGSSFGLNSLEAIVQRLTEKLENKRFFLVLDDLWEKDCNNCDILKGHLQTICNRAGNFIMLTTRLMIVAEAMGTHTQHVVRLKHLSDNECWQIIREKCLMQWGGSMPEELEEIGVVVAEKCKGVPLAAKVVGGTLCKKMNRAEWLSIRNNDAWEQIDEQNQIFPVLILSFERLDASIKQCFVYCSIFPKDFRYNKEKLIELWMAEGFLNSTATNRGASMRSMEDVGDECFDGLIVHSFFQDAEVDEWGNIISCKMHDLLHDVATSVSNYKRLSLKDDSLWIVRRTFNHQHDPSAEELERSESRNVRSLIFKAFGDVSHMFFTFRSLRSVDISYAGLEELSSAIGRLKHLRFLDISYNINLKELPVTITKLYNLQTLHINWCRGIIMLPIGMVNLKRLRHIHFNMHDLKIYNVGGLTELRTLPWFEVRAEEGFRIEELKSLNELRGKLSIGGLENVRDREEAKRANLKEKKLVELNLEWNGDSNNNNDENVLEGLLPPSTIQRLNILGYKGVAFPNWMSMGINNSHRQLTQLVELRLQNCDKCEMMPSLGHLPCLELLWVEGLNNVRCIGSEFYGECKRDVTLFPQLKTFYMRFMMSVEEWGPVVASEGCEETSIKIFPLLERLLVWDCPRLRSIPLRYLSSLVGLTIEGCEDMEYLSNDIQNPPSLNYLRIEECPKLKNIPHWIKDCSSLRELIIWDCKGLIFIDDNIISSLAQLKKLSLGLFSEELEDFPGLNSIHHLSPSIEELRLFGWEKLKSLPHNLQYLTGLQSLDVWNFKGLEALPDWLCNLSSLQQLQLYDCDILKNLPTTMKRLPNLRLLRSEGCPLLAQRYNHDTHDISHIAERYFC